MTSKEKEIMINHLLNDSDLTPPYISFIKELIKDSEILEGIRNTVKVIDYGEGIEEELGCPLDVVYKALKQGFIYSYVFSEDELIKWQITHFTIYKDFGYVLQTINGIKCGLGRNGYNQYVHLDCEIFMLKEYKKSWWLKEDKSE